MAAVTEDLTEPMEVKNPNIEIVQFTTASNGDTYDFKKLGSVICMFTGQVTTDSIETGAILSTLSTGQKRATMVLSTECSGCLVAFGGL